ncbi:hypothetical protein Z947_1093 [Sulfitobacter geojensis]|nr:hypothetical protein Z947_1093 [Sulfitobacter geojensis]
MMLRPLGGTRLFGPLDIFGNRLRWFKPHARQNPGFAPINSINCATDGKYFTRSRQSYTELSSLFSNIYSKLPTAN